MTDAPAVVQGDELDAALAALPDWRSRAGWLNTAYGAPSAAAALALVAAIGQAAEAANHHPDVDWRYDHVFVRTTTHEVGTGITERDLSLAARISELATDVGAKAEPDGDRTE